MNTVGPLENSWKEAGLHVRAEMYRSKEAEFLRTENHTCPSDELCVKDWFSLFPGQRPRKIPDRAHMLGLEE